MRPAFCLIVALAACSADCPTISERFELDNPDSDLQALVDDCVAHKAAPGEICEPAADHASIVCGCLPLCQRVLEIANQFPGTPKIETCSYAQAAASSPDGGARPPGTVYVTYRMASCS